MIVCSPHWEQLRRLVCEAAMGHLMHQRPHDEFEEFAAQICGHRRISVAFDPMTAARKVAEDLAIAYGSLYLALPGNAARCSVCELVKCNTTTPAGYGANGEEFWPLAVIEIVARDARKRGLMPRAA